MWFDGVASTPTSLRILVLLVFNAQTQLLRDFLLQVLDERRVVLFRKCADTIAPHGPGRDASRPGVVVGISDHLAKRDQIASSRHNPVELLVPKPMFRLQVARVQLNLDHVEDARVQVLSLETGLERLQKRLAVLD